MAETDKTQEVVDRIARRLAAISEDHRDLPSLEDAVEDELIESLKVDDTGPPKSAEETLDLLDSFKAVSPKLLKLAGELSAEEGELFKFRVIPWGIIVPPDADGAGLDLTSAQIEESLQRHGMRRATLREAIACLSIVRDDYKMFGIPVSYLADRLPVVIHVQGGLVFELLLLDEEEYWIITDRDDGSKFTSCHFYVGVLVEEETK